MPSEGGILDANLDGFLMLHLLKVMVIRNSPRNLSVLRGIGSTTAEARRNVDRGQFWLSGFWK